MPRDALECPRDEFWLLLLAEHKVVITKGRLPERLTSLEGSMHGRTGAVATGPAGPAGGGLAPPAARVTPARGRQRPGMHPWPLFSALGPVGALPTAPGLARAFTAMVLGGWDLARVNDLGEVSALVVSELATNVVQLATAGDGSPRYQADGRLTELWLRLMSDRVAAAGRGLGQPPRIRRRSRRSAAPQRKRSTGGAWPSSTSSATAGAATRSPACRPSPSGRCSRPADPVPPRQATRERGPR